MKQNKVIYKEVQKPRSFLYWSVILAFSGFLCYVFISQIILGVPVGKNPMPDVILYIFLVIVVSLIFAKLVIEIREDGIYIYSLCRFTFVINSFYLRI